ncbi:MAG: FAD-binding oxidoreductase [Candidatus Thorarchaeota archaeon]
MNEVQVEAFDIRKLDELPWISSSLAERLSASGDTTGTPYYHYRWKKKWLADYVAWPIQAEDVSSLLEYASAHQIPVVARGGGTCYYGSASPTRGGLVVDTKRMNKILEINSEQEWVRVQAGAVFEVVDLELSKHGLALRVAPQSAVASTIAGWLGTGGKSGIGTPKYGSFSENILEAEVVRPDGRIETIDGEDIEEFEGTAGITGIITQIKMRVRSLPETVGGFMYAFYDLDAAIRAVDKLSKARNKPVYLRMTDLEYEWRIQGGLPPHSRGSVFVLAVYDGSVTVLKEALDTGRQILEEAGGQDLGPAYYEKGWEERFKVEMKLKLEVPTLSMQNFWIPLTRIGPVVRKMNKIAENYSICSCFYLVYGNRNMTRMCVFAPSDHRHWMHFMAGKTMLHHLVKTAYQEGAELYTYGLQNSIYLKRYQPEHYHRFIELRQKWDPNGIMNPDKLTHTNISYTRMNLMFNMNGLFRRLQIKLRGRETLCDVPVSGQGGIL